MNIVITNVAYNREISCAASFPPRFYPLRMKIAYLYPDIVVTAFADKVAVVGVQSQVLSAVDQFATM